LKWTVQDSCGTPDTVAEPPANAALVRKPLGQTISILLAWDGSWSVIRNDPAPTAGARAAAELDEPEDPELLDVLERDELLEERLLDERRLLGGGASSTAVSTALRRLRDEAPVMS
jgi:hypothetical protein